jgi:hypothetical protein
VETLLNDSSIIPQLRWGGVRLYTQLFGRLSQKDHLTPVQGHLS